jgi:DNA polymerase-1
MLVTSDNLEEVISYLISIPVLAIDCETTGLRPYHGDVPFIIAISNGVESWIFEESHYDSLCFLFSDPFKTWIGFNTKFDLHHLAQVGLQIAGETVDVRVEEKLLHQHLTNNLETVAKFYGYAKSDAVEKYIDQFQLYSKVHILGKKEPEKRLHYDRVPKEILYPYAENDAKITYQIYRRQCEEFPKKAGPPQRLEELRRTERALSRVVFHMERTGLRVDRDYLERAAGYYEARKREAEARYALLTGGPFSASSKLFQKIFADQEDQWSYTEKGNPSFNSVALKKLTGPIVETIFEYRDSKKSAEFCYSLLYHADPEGRVHPSLDQAGPRTGRFSSQHPNLQQLPSIEDEDAEYPIRGAILPEIGHVLLDFDYVSMEMGILFAYAGEESAIRRMQAGEDIHQALADQIGISRRMAKTLGFALVYGAGITLLAERLGVSEKEAKELKQKYFTAIPKASVFMREVIRTAESRGWIFNAYGRVLPFPVDQYKALNYIIQSTGADCMKRALVDIFKYLKDKKSLLLLTVHDSVLISAHPEEVEDLKRDIAQILSDAFILKNFKLEASYEIYPERWGVLGGAKAGDGVSAKSSPPVPEASPQLCLFPDPAALHLGGSGLHALHPG